MDERFGRGKLRNVILEYVKANGACTTLDIRDELGIGLDRIGNVLTRLRLEGLVENEKAEGDRVARWSATDGECEKGGVPVIIRCQEWTGPKIERQTWASALHWSPA